MATLNSTEFDLMQSRLRRFAQRHVELRVFRAMLRSRRIELRNKIVLEVGCGSGYGLSLLRDAFTPKRLIGFDLMPEQIALARSRAAFAETMVGDVTAIPLPSASVDAAFVFAILHHVPGWRDGLREIVRVLRPGGVLLVEELSGQAVALSDRYVGTRHPMGSRFTWADFRAGLAEAGLTVREERRVAADLVHAFLAEA